MNSLKMAEQVIRMMLVAVFLMGCATSTVAPTLPPTFLPPPQPSTPLPRPPQPPQPNTPLPPSPPPLPTQADLFKFIGATAVTPDDKFLAGGFIRLGYVPASDRIVAAFGSPKLAKPIGNCKSGGKAYKIYTVDMLPTGQSGVLHCEGGGDTADLFVDNVLYDVVMIPVNGKEGWLIKKFDAVTWKELGRLTYGLDSPRELSGDMTIEMVNGELDISGSYSSNGKVPLPGEGAGTHHNFFTPDLKFLGKKILTDTEHIVGSSMIDVDGVIYFITANDYAEDVIVMKYDKDWKYLGMKVLRTQAHWSEGVAYDGQRFYLSYLDTSQRTVPGMFPYYPNVHLAAFDRDWNLLDDVAVTSYTPADNMTTGRPWLLMRGNRLYVAYDVAKRDASGNDNLETIEVKVSIYELTPKP